MQPLRFVMIGGFLGAGKTTTLARLAKHYAAAGRKVALVTNDQAQDLVDTNSLRAQGFPVEEVSGACFCCSFNDLIGKVEKLRIDRRPDLILAEPVGSCTDLVATVVQPLKHLYAEQFEVAPYAVLFKPSHGLRILRNLSGAGFSPKAAYIFRKQLQEADAIVLNAIDSLAAADIREIEDCVHAEFPQTPLLKVSARTGEGFDKLLEFLEQRGAFGRKILDIDYDVYAEGEAEMGWHNSSVHLESEQAFDMDSMLLEVVDTLQKVLLGRGEVAHLKVIGLAGSGFGVANLVSSQSRAELSIPARAATRELDLIVNARVAIDPDELSQAVERATAEAAQKRQAALTLRALRSLRPGRPTPTHRYAEAH